MKKIFSVMILSTIIFFCGQNNFANAKDVYAGNTGGLNFFVDTNSIRFEERHSFYVNVKKLDENTGRLKDTNQWKFYSKDYCRAKFYSCWLFDYYLSGKGIPVESNQIAKNILGICRDYDKRVMRE